MAAVDRGLVVVSVFGDYEGNAGKRRREEDRFKPGVGPDGDTRATGVLSRGLVAGPAGTYWRRRKAGRELLKSGRQQRVICQLR